MKIDADVKNKQTWPVVAGFTVAILLAIVGGMLLKNAMDHASSGADSRAEGVVTSAR